MNEFGSKNIKFNKNAILRKNRRKKPRFFVKIKRGIHF